MRGQDAPSIALTTSLISCARTVNAGFSFILFERVMQWSPASANALRSYRALTFPGGRSCQAQCSRRAQPSQRSTAPYALIGARHFQIFAADGVRRNQRRVRTRWVVTGILWKGACPSRPDRYISALLITVDRAGVGIGPHDGATARMRRLVLWSRHRGLAIHKPPRKFQIHRP